MISFQYMTKIQTKFAKLDGQKNLMMNFTSIFLCSYFYGTAYKTIKLKDQL